MVLQRQMLGLMAVMLLGACASVGPRDHARLDRDALGALDGVIEEAIDENRMPGAVIVVGTADGVAYRKAYGMMSRLDGAAPMSEDAVFDLASLTKVTATTPSIMKLVEQGRLTLDMKVSDIWPEYERNGKGDISIRHLMTHTAGLPPGLAIYGRWGGANKGRALGDAAWQDVMPGIRDYVASATLRSEPGTRFVYSDISFITLGEIVRRVSGVPLDEFARREIFAPIGMTETVYTPGAELKRRAVITQERDGRPLLGEVHDPSSWAMGGVAGHAGLFSTADDMARYCRMLLGSGEVDCLRVLSPLTVRAMTSPATPEGLPVRALGWDLDSGYSRRGDLFGARSFGHTGFTGTSLWIDPASGVFVVLLTNRVHPDGRASISNLQRRVSNIVAAAVRDLPARALDTDAPPRPDAVERTTGSGAADAADTPAEFARVLTGVDVLQEESFKRLAGRRIGLITNPTGVSRDRVPTIDLFYERHKAGDLTMVALFAPEHGIRAALDEPVPDERDAATGLPVYSLYDPHVKRYKPTAKMLEGIDTLVFDIQDIGVRYYTYISTMAQAMESAAEHKLKFVVLDRPNPINGEAIDGPELDPALRSFVAWFDVPVRHGMTVGELAKWYHDRQRIDCELEVVPMRGWRRSMWLDQTGQPWVNPSPNIRDLTEATLYAAIGPIELAKLSVGRGTDRPFELFGAPWIEDDVELAGLLNARSLPGLTFVPAQFTPDTREFKGQLCRGVAVQLLDRNAMEGMRTAATILDVLVKRYGAETVGLSRTNRLFGNGSVPEAIAAGTAPEKIAESWQAGVDRFRRERERYLMCE